MNSWVALSLGLLFAAGLRGQAAQTAPPANDAKRSAAAAAPDIPGEKSDPKKRGKELLDSAAEMVSSVQPQVQVVALLHIAESYRFLD
jgi:hypothetical protein